MTRILRIFLTVLSVFFKKPLSPFQDFSITLRVWPNEVDVSYLNQSIYSFYFELGRWDFIYRTGLKKVMRKLECLPITASQSVRVIRPLKRFQKCEVVSKISAWDEKWVYIEHYIYSQNKLVASGLVKGLFRSSEGIVSTEQMFRELDIEPPEREVPEMFKRFQESEDGMVGLGKERIRS